MIHSLLRIIKFAFQNFFRNFWLSVATLTVLVITLLLINVIISIDQIKIATLQGIENKVDISLDFKQTVPEAEVLRIRKDLQSDERINSVDIITPDENLDRFTERYPEIGEKVVPVLDKNPLGYTLQVQAYSIDDYGSILTDLETNESYKPLLENTRFNDFRSLTSNAASLSERVNTAVIVLAVIFLVIAIIIVFNAIRVSIYTHREEIWIMQLVGATKWFIRTPFLFEGVIYSAAAIILIVGIIFGTIQFVQPVLDRYFADFTTIDLLNYYRINALPVFGMQFVGILLINVTSTAIALRRYLRS